MNEELIRVPTLDGLNRCVATTDDKILCAKFGDCGADKCDSGFSHIWITPAQKHEYLALKLVS